MFYHCADLEAYIAEVDPKKVCVLLVNKADYLSPALLNHWEDYFNERKFKFFFFSAKKEQAIIDGEEIKEYSPKILSSVQLLDRLKDIIKEKWGTAEGEKEKEEKKIQNSIIGMVGYPNVGKSSVINVLCGRKKVLFDV